MAEYNVLAELERCGLKYDFAGPQEVKVRCPFHPDDSPSCQVNTEKAVFYCQVCHAKGDVVALLAGVLKVARGLVLEELGSRYDMRDVRIVEMDVVMRWHEAIWQAFPLLTELRKRMVSDAVIKLRRLGVDGGRITIPIPNHRGDFVNVRRYLPGAAGAEKMRNMRGRGTARWYPEDQLDYPVVMVTGGEIKAIAAAEQLNPHGCGAACVTQAEKLILPELMKRLAGKVVYWAMDIDAAGRNANEANLRAAIRTAAEQYDFLLPLDPTKYPKGDVNDFLATGGDLWKTMQELEPWQQPQPGIRTPDEEPEYCSLADSANARYAGRRIRVKALVQATGVAPYPIPKDVVVKCEKDQKFCSLCPVHCSPDGRFTISPESPALLEMVDARKGALREALMGGVGIPRACRVCEFEVEGHYNAEDARLVPQLEIANRAVDNKMQPAICIGDGIDLMESYELVGRMHPHPQTQQSTLLISRYTPTQDALSTYEPKNLHELELFRPETWTEQAVADKLDHLYGDLESTVTRIKFRRDAHLAMDLAYHSVLFIPMGGPRPVKGWVEVLVAGDSSQGKSETASAFMRHYNLGEIVSCKNATAAGLLGGLQQFGGSKWFVSWGFFVMHDKRLLILEELKGMRTDEFGKLTDMRSSGIAELSKIEKRRAHARTRLIALSNARPDMRTVGSYNHGVDLVRELVGGLEDVRRFDTCLIQSADEVDAAELNRWTGLLNGTHTQYDGDLCRRLILWAWTRNLEQVQVSKETATRCQDEATRLCERFTEAIPIVDRGSMRYKLVRLATALAARTYSASDDGQAVVVRPCHVDYVSHWLDRMYSAPAYGYLAFTETVRGAQELVDTDELVAIIRNTAFPRDLVASMLRTERIDVQDIQDWLAIDRGSASDLLSAFVRKHALNRDKTGYRKTAAFVALLKKIQRDMPDRPAGPQGPKF